MLTMNLGQLMDRGGRAVSVLSADLGSFRGTRSTDTACMTMVDAIAEGVPSGQISFLQFNGVRLLPIRSAIPQLNQFVDLREPRAARVIARARQMGDVLIDLPPFSASADALALATHADIVILIAAESVTTSEDLNETCGKLRHAGANVLGAVLNRSRL